jgi:tetratricopeptide (TPR) repeat protein
VELSKPTVLSEDPAPRLLRWSRPHVPGLAWVEYHDERTRQQFFERFAWMLRKEGLPLHQLRLQPAETPAAVVWALLNEMQALPPGVCSITGFTTALPSEPYALAEALYAFSFQREALGKVPHRQIWWLPSYVADALIRTVPDLESWFTLRLQIEDQVPHLSTPQGLIEPIGLRSADPAEAARRARELITRFDQAVAKERNPIDAVQKLGLPALAAYREAGDEKASRPLAERLRGLAPGLFSPTSDETVPHRRIADMLNNAHLLRQAGFLPEAAGVLEAAVDEGRSALASRGPLSELALAHALKMHGVCLDELGLKERALDHSLEAVHLFRRLAQQDPDPNLPRLAEALNNLAHVLAGMGRTSDALPAVSEAVHVLRKLADLDPRTYEPQLALALNNLASHLGTLRRNEEAVPVARESVALFRRCLDHRGQADKQGLAMALNNLSVHLGMSGQETEALVMAEEATAIYGKLAELEPPRHTSDHAHALQSLALRRGHLHHSEEAIAAARQSVELYRELVAVDPHRHSRMLAEALLGLSLQLKLAHLPQEALSAAEEALIIHRRLQTDPAHENPIQLAEALLMLAECQMETGCVAKARETALAAVQTLAGTHPASSMDALEATGAALATLAAMQEKLGEPKAARASFEQAVRLLSPAFCRLPDRLNHLMGPLLSHYLRLCQALNDMPDGEWIDPIVRLAMETPSPWQLSGDQDPSAKPPGPTVPMGSE